MSCLRSSLFLYDLCRRIRVPEIFLHDRKCSSFAAICVHEADTPVCWAIELEDFLQDISNLAQIFF